MKKIALLFGGKSPEHEISVRSARNIFAAMDRRLFDILLIGVDQTGHWRLLETFGDWKFVPRNAPQLSLIPGNDKGKLVRTDLGEAIPDPDAVFLIIHGTNGEDGTVQGLLRIMDLPFTGPDVLSSAIAMDKDVAKRLLKMAGLNVANGIVVHAGEQEQLNYYALTEKLGTPIFVKPANMGSSVGVTRVCSEADFAKAVKDAFLYDRKILIEEMIHGRELECAILGNQNPEATEIGEIVVVSKNEYSFEAKYTSETAAQLLIPTEVPDETLPMLRETALKAYKALECEVMARVDMFLTENGTIYVNEVNTLPGFTNISMYPQLWEAAGISYSELISQLLGFAISRWEEKKKLKTEWRTY